MTESQEKAWNYLTELEQQALFLQIVKGKTSWEVGEILNISHYKYLELKERSQQFFRIFTDYFDRYSALFNPMANVSDKFRDYIEASIEKRYSKSLSRRYSGDSSELVPSINKVTILRGMAKLKHSSSQWDKDLYQLILEFDRWNTFRILPLDIQLISAYKRRVNKKFKIYLKWIMKLKPFVVSRLEERYSTKSTHNIYYACLTSYKQYAPKGYNVIKIDANNKEAKATFTRLNIYLWPTQEDAESFGLMVSLFTPNTGTVKTGQKFWPDYHNLINKAINFKDINHTNFTMYTLNLSHSTYR